MSFLYERGRDDVAKIRANGFGVFESNVFCCFSILDCYVGLSFLNVLGRLEGGRQVLFKCLDDRLRRILRFFIVVTGIRYDAQRRVEQTGRCQVACFLRGSLRIFRANRLLPYQLICPRLVRRYERLVAVLNTISEGEEDARCQGELAVRFRDRIVQGLSACECGRATELLRIGSVRCAFRQGFVGMRAIARVVIDERHFKIVVGRGQFVSRLANDLRDVCQAPIRLGQAACAVDT